MGLFGIARPTRPVVRAYGKVPWARDFVRVGSLDGNATRFVEWLERGLETAKGVIGGPWDVLFDTGDAQAFTFRSTPGARSAELLAGVALPSRDAVGRRFPFVVYVSLPGAAFASAPHCAPLVLNGFLEAARATAYQASSVDGPAALEALVARVTAPDPAKLDAARAEYDGWIPTEAVSTLALRLLGVAEPLRLAHAISALADAVYPVRADEQTRSRLAIRLPVGQPRAFSSALWIDIFLHIAAWRKTTPTAFWPLSDDLGAMILLPGEATDPVLAELWAPSPMAEQVFDVAWPFAQGRLDNPLAEQIGQSISVSMMLQTLGALG
ncbi:MAG: type VI secretion system-associated protein TagF [Polyangiaceae bacterium]|nr:type VI secretion system-associated protein TagF [Polyangiaceae bacterium]